MSVALPAVSLSLLRAAPSAVVALDEAGRITMLNAAAESIFGLNGSPAIGMDCAAALGQSVVSKIVSLCLRTPRLAQPRIIDTVLPSGRRLRLRATAGPLRDERGAPIGILFVADDETKKVEGERVHGALRRYVDDKVADLIEQRASFVDVGGTRQTLSVMHADVRGYTTIAETLEPELVVKLLLRYHGAAANALRSAGAFIDRFAGDAILAFWNAPMPREDHLAQAVRGALALQAAVGSVGEELRYGVGVHTGEAVVGNLGSDEFMNYTAIGDTINVAARLQAAASPGEVLCSAAVVDALGHRAKAIPLGALQLKGRRSPVEAFRLEALS